MRDPALGAPPVQDGEPEAQAPSPSPPPQKKGGLTPIEGGKSAAIPDVLSLSTFGQWAREQGLTQADLTSAWSEGEKDGYPCRERYARFREGKLSVSDNVEQPTDAQIAAFEAEFTQAAFPTIVPLTAVGDLPPGVTSLTADDTFTYHDFDDRIVMIRKRYETQDGGKGFLPFTYWSDGQWRRTEPEVLPFYGLPGRSNHSTLVIHEGEKAARHLKRLLDGEVPSDRFPWLNELRFAQHVGWIGGTNAVSRSDWPRLAQCGWKRVIIVVDNDEDGKGLKASASIARNFSHVWLLTFDQRFKDGFDLADEWPEELFDGEERYVGPPMADFLLPATYATREVPTGERGRPAHVLTDDFAKTVACTASPERIMFRHNPGRDYRPEQFNRAVAPISAVADTASKVFKDERCSHDRMLYRPGFRAGTLNHEGRCFNVYEPGRVKPLEGDPAPWLDYLEHLFPVGEDREHVSRWLATLIALPKVRMIYGMLLISGTHGVGKSTLHFILEQLLGQRNVSAPNETMIVDSQFNTWLARKRLIFVHEFYSGQSRKAYDKLKTFITEPSVEINEKGIPAYPMENWAHFIACSNSDAALHLDDNDRRWLVPTVSERLKPHSYWVGLRAWLRADGLGIILAWAQRFVREHGAVAAGLHAPMSSRKREIIEASRSPGQAIASEIGEALAALDRKVIIRTDDLLAHVALRRGFKRAAGDPDLAHGRLEKKDTLLRAVKNVPGITVWANAKRPKFGTTKDSVILNFSATDDVPWSEVKDYLTTLSDLHFGEPM